MTNEEKHAMLTASAAETSAAVAQHQANRAACGLTERCCQTVDGWLAWDGEIGKHVFGHSTVAEGPEVAVERAAKAAEVATA